MLLYDSSGLSRVGGKESIPLLRHIRVTAEHKAGHPLTRETPSTLYCKSALCHSHSPPGSRPRSNHSCRTATGSTWR
jgi:hypothetical protein